MLKIELTKYMTNDSTLKLYSWSNNSKRPDMKQYYIGFRKSNLSFNHVFYENFGETKAKQVFEYIETIEDFLESTGMKI